MSTHGEWLWGRAEYVVGFESGSVGGEVRLSIRSIFKRKDVEDEFGSRCPRFFDSSHLLKADGICSFDTRAFTNPRSFNWDMARDILNLID
ncbi:hypothetical protein Tco_0067381 [Tanacetum coccineum]